jgi:tetraacyldisaccharide 4'-kinase
LRSLEPNWWYQEGSRWQARLLSPVAALVGGIATARLKNPSPYCSRLPVICVGNFTVGGSGKTPLALFLARLLLAEGRQPWFLSRGYGGRLKGPLQVEIAAHTAADVGDEPLLLAQAAPTVIARDRPEGAKLIESAAASDAVIIMDDGLQNPSLSKDLAIALVDADRGFGNGLVLPAGPLRAPLGAQIGLAGLIVMTGRGITGNPALARHLRTLTNAPIVSARTEPAAPADTFHGRRVLAYAGIANPDRFFQILKSLGTIVVECRAFADHHSFSDSEARELLDSAGRMGADLVTTEKDFIRLAGAQGVRAELRKRSMKLAIQMTMEGSDLATFKEVLRAALQR